MRKGLMNWWAGGQEDCTGIVDAPTLIKISTSADGNSMELVFSKAMNNPTGKHTQFSYTINGVVNSFTAASLKSGYNTRVILTCGTQIANGNAVTLTYNYGGTVSATDNGKMTPIAGAYVINAVPASATDIPYFENYDFVLDPRNAAGLTLSGSNIVSMNDLSGCGQGRKTTGGGNSAQYDSVNKFINLNVAAGSLQFYTFPFDMPLTTSDWTIAFVMKFPNISAQLQTFSGALGGNFLNFPFGSAGGANFGVSLGVTQIIPTSSNPALQKINSTSTKYRIIIRKIGTVITYWVNAVSSTSASTSIARDYGQRFRVEAAANGQNIYFLMFGNYITDADMSTLDTFLQTI